MKRGDIQGGVRVYNNVQQVEWENIPPGEVQLCVQAEHLVEYNGSSRQSFAIVWRLVMN